MESLRGDPELAAEMVGLMGRELKLTRKKAKDLERELTEKRKRISVLEASHKADLERAEAAEYTRDIFKLNMENFGKENQQLTRELEHVQRTYSREIKQEDDEFIHAGLDNKGLKLETTAKIKKSESDLTKLQSKFDAQQGETQALQKTCEGLESRVMELEMENLALNKRLDESRDSQQKLVEMDAKLKRLEAARDAESIPQVGSKRTKHKVEQDDTTPNIDKPEFQEYLSKFSLPPSHPQFHRLYAVQDSHTDLAQYLPPILNAARCTTNFIHFPGRIIWPSSMRYALVFSPFSICSGTSRFWERSSELSSSHGYVRELFYSNETSVYYAGTFRCIETSTWFPDGVKLPKSISATSIAEVAIQGTTSPAFHMAKVVKAFAEGIMKSECMLLECVGFNRHLYRSLLEHYSPDTALQRFGECGTNVDLNG